MPAEPRPAAPQSQASASPQPVSVGGTLPVRLIDLYKLSESEQRIVLALLAARAQVSVADLAVQLALPVSQLLSLLAPEGVLRSCALVELPDSAELGWALPQDAISVSRGLHPLVSGEGMTVAAADDKAPLVSLLPGLSSLAAPPPDLAWAKELPATQPNDRATSAIADVVREQLVAPQAVLLSLGGCSLEQVPVLAQQVRLRLQRPVLTLDGAALAGWPLPLLVPALRRLRRDSDLRGAVLIVHEARALGGALRALLRPRPHAQTAPVVLVSDGAPLVPGALPPSPRGEPAWTVASQSLRGTAPASQPASSSGTAGPGADSRDDSEDPAVSASRQEARRQAAIDAARAMGRPVPKELTNPPAPAAAAAASPARTAPAATPAPTAIPSSGPPPGKMAAPPASAPAPVPAPAPAPANEAAPRRAPNPRLAAALAAAGLPPVGSEQYRGGEPPSRRPGSAAESPAASAPRESAVAAPPAPVAAPPAPVAAPTAPTDPVIPETAQGAASPAAPLEEDDSPPLPLEAEAPVEEVVRVARATGNQAQRLELLRKLTGARHSHVIALFRSFVQSPHPAIREAAEGGMSAIFGPNWNRSRQIAPPVQPPRSDDNGRGPGGAF